jgi:hypothetical protein
LKLVNLSRGGALVESPERYAMRSGIRLALTRASGAVTVKTANVSWAQVASIVNMRISYLLAFTFDTPIPDFEAATGANDLELEPAGRIEPAPADSTPAHAEKGLADASDADLREQLAAAMSQIAENSTATQSLVARLEATESERNSLRDVLENERQQAQARLQLDVQAEDARTRAESERALAERDRAHQQALDAARLRYDALVAELMDVANAQEVEFQRQLAERLAARDQQYARAEHMAAELARLRAAGTRALADWDRIRQELTSRAERAEARCAAYEERHAAVKQEAEKLLTVVTAAISPILVDSVSLEENGEDRSHAVA